MFSDDAEGENKFKLNGFVVSNGFEKKKHYYYLEWRNYAGSDKGLNTVAGITDNRGLVVWYADDSFKDNWVKQHPGEGFLGVVDSHPEAGRNVPKLGLKFQVVGQAEDHTAGAVWIHR